MEIRCSECKTYLGDIEKARLKKGIVHLCSQCETARNLMKNAKRHTADPIGDIFGDILGRKRS